MPNQSVVHRLNGNTHLAKTTTIRHTSNVILMAGPFESDIHMIFTLPPETTCNKHSFNWSGSNVVLPMGLRWSNGAGGGGGEIY